MKNHPVWYLVIAIFILVVPTTIYLIFLVPCLTEEYNVLMASSGVIGGSGMTAANYIPESWDKSKLLKLAARSFTILTVITIVEKFIIQLVGLVATFILSYILFKIFVGVWKNARRQKEHRELANEITRNVAKIVE